MHPRLALLVVFFFTATCIAVAQDSTRFQLGFGTGVTFDAVKVDFTSPVPHKGVAVPLQLLYSENRQRSRSYFLLSYVNLNYKSDVSAFSTREQKGYLQTAYFYQVPLDEWLLRLFVGGVLDAQAYRRTTSYNGNEFGNNATVQGTTSICPGFFGELPLAHGLFTGQLSTAIFSYFGGSGYALSFPADSEWMWPGQYTVTQYRIAYQRPVASRLALRADYQFTYRWLTVNEPIGWVSNQALVSVVYSFGKPK